MNQKRVQRIWRREGLKVPEKQPKRGRLWLNGGSIVRLRPERPNHVWAYDFVAARTHDGSVLRLLNIIDEYTWECLAIKAERHILAHNVVECLGDLFLEHGVPEHVRSDNRPEFTAKAVRRWIDPVGAKTLFIQPGSPWENGYVESFNGKLRDELLNGEVFYTLQEVRVVTDLWRRHCNHYRPHSALGYRPPAPEVISSNTGIPALALIHRRTACRRPAEETKGCASESGILVLKQKTGPIKGAPDSCYHVTTPTASNSPSTTTAWWPMQG